MTANHIHMVPGVSVPIYFYTEKFFARLMPAKEKKVMVAGGAFSSIYHGELDFQGKLLEQQPYPDYIGKPMIFLGTELVKRTTPEEIQALAWHEEGHCVLGHIHVDNPDEVIDNVKFEMEADQFALSKGAKKKDLQSGIKKSINVIYDTLIELQGVSNDNIVVKVGKWVINLIVALTPSYRRRLFSMRHYA